MRILLVEDERQLACQLTSRLVEGGFVVDHVVDAEHAEAAASTTNYPLIILDRRLPDGDGLTKVRDLRAILPDVRIIILTALDATQDKVRGLDAGADDYLTKPFEFDELMARIRAALRRPGGATQPAICCANILYDPAPREFRINGEALVFKRREHLILEALIMRSRRVVQRETFMEQVYGFDDDVQSNTLDAQISRLRARLIQLDAGVAIHPIRGVGYMLTESKAP